MKISSPVFSSTVFYPTASLTKGVIIIFNYALQPIVRSWLDVPTFATRSLHVCHYARARSGGKWNCGKEMSGNFA